MKRKEKKRKEKERKYCTILQGCGNILKLISKKAEYLPTADSNLGHFLRDGPLHQKETHVKKNPPVRNALNTNGRRGQEALGKVLIFGGRNVAH